MRNILRFEYPRRVRFRCNRCALCCGDTKDKVRAILILELEAGRISQKTSKSIADFARRIENREPYVYEMAKDAAGKCVFLKDNACTIYRLRPLICKFYPFELKSAAKERHVFAYTNECPCIGKGRRLTRSYFDRLFQKSLKTIEKKARK